MRTADDWYVTGFTDLVCVSPPDCKLSPDSRLAPESRGKAPAVLGPSGWAGYDWRKHTPTQGDVDRWARAGANVGLRTDRYPTFDLDVDDPTVAHEMERVLLETVGDAPVRVGRAPRRALLYGCLAGVRKRRLRFELGGVAGAVEVLGVGQQVVVEGQHPSGSAYRWERWHPTERGPERIKWLRPADVDRGLNALRSWIVERGGLIQGDTANDGGLTPDQNTLRGPPNLIRMAMARIPNGPDVDRDYYIKMGYALKAAMGDEGLGVWSEWCDRWEGGTNDPETVERDWEGMHGPFEVGAGWILGEARSHGFDDAPVDFVADLDARAAPEASHPKPDIYSDAHIASRFLAQYGDRVRWLPEMGQWASWTGAGWEVDQDGRVPRWIGQVCIEACEEARRSSQMKAGEAKRHMAKLSSVKMIGQVDQYARLSPRTLGRLDEFDRDPWVLPTPAGLVDLKSGEIRPHVQSVLTLGKTRVSPEHGPARHWGQFLSETCGGDLEMVLYLQRSVGYWLSGAIYEHALWFLYGSGGNGKSTFLNAISWAMGDFSRSSPMSAFTASTWDAHPTEIAMLRGARLVTAQETQEGRAWNEARIKQLTGGDPVSARFMRKDFFTFVPCFHLVFSGNHRPRITSLDDAMRRRFQMVPFVRRPRRVDHQLSDKLREEAGRILAWAIEGHVAWLEDGLSPPDQVLAATSEYFETQDPVGSWMDERTTLDPDGRVTTSELFRSWRGWAELAGEPARSERWLSEELGKRGLTRHRFGGGGPRGFMGIRLSTEWDMASPGGAQ